MRERWNVRFRCMLPGLLMVLCLGCNLGGGPAKPGGNLLKNGDLTKGTGNSPDNWDASPSVPGSVLGWHHHAGAPGELTIFNAQPADVHWSQRVHLTSGWYHCSASMRAEKVPRSNAGANLSLLEDGIISVPLYGTTDWRTVDFYLKVGKSGADVTLACRLGGYSSINTGKAFCRNLRIMKIRQPPADATPSYDLDEILGPAAPVSAPTSIGPATQWGTSEAQADRETGWVGKFDLDWIDRLDWAMAFAVALAALTMAGARLYNFGLSGVRGLAAGAQEAVRGWWHGGATKLAAWRYRIAGLFAAPNPVRSTVRASRARLGRIASKVTAARTDSEGEVRISSVSLQAMSWGEVLLIAAGVLSFVAAFSYPILQHLSRMGIVDDWSEHLQPNWAAFYSITHFHQAPLWNPYRCGGMPLLGHPLSLVASPLFLLQIIFGPFVGLSMQIPVHLAIAWTGGYVLGRSLGMDFPGRIICASVFPASSWFYLHIAVGHLEYLPTMYMPWIAALAWLGTTRKSLMPWVAAGLLLAITFGEGGVYQALRVLLLSSLLTGYWAATRRSLRPIEGMIILGAFAAGFAAIKLLPTWQVMQLHPRPIQDVEYNTVRALLTGVFTRDQFWDRYAAGRTIANGSWAFFELGNYVSPLAIILAMLGIVFSPRRSFPWVVAAALFFTLAIGGPKPWYPWPLLHRLPIYASERVPSRFLMAFTLPVGVIAGFGADAISGRLKPWGAIVCLAIVIAAVVDAWTVSRTNFAVAVEREAPALTMPTRAFQQFWGSPWEMVWTNLENRGAVFCNEGLDFYDVSRRSVVGVNEPGYFGEQFLIGAGSVTLRRWTPNALDYDVDTPVRNVLVINQVYDPNWLVASGAGEVVSQGTMIGVRLPPGAQHLELVYRSYPFRIGVATTLLTCIAALLLWRIDYVTRRRANQY